MSAHEKLSDQLTRFNEDEWGQACRKMQVGLLNRNFEQVRHTLNEFIIGLNEEKTVDATTPVAQVFNVRIANSMQDAGYDNLGSVINATDAELLRIPNFGQTTLNFVRDRIKNLREMTPVKRDYPANNSLVATGAKTMTSLEEAIDALANAGPEALSEIDKKIADLESQIQKYKRIQKLLGTKKGKRSSGQDRVEMTPERIAIADAAKQILKKDGPKRIKDLATALEKSGHKVHYLVLSKICASVSGLSKSEEGLIQLVA